MYARQFKAWIMKIIVTILLISLSIPSLLFSIKSLFDKKHRNRLYCRYKVCIGRGFAPYFIEISARYLGNPLNVIDTLF
jgi:hypothetical protein